MFFCLSNSFSSQLLGSCRFAAKLLWPTAYTSPPARVCAVKPAHGNDAAIFACFLFCTAPFPRKNTAQERHKNILPLSGRIFNQFSHIYSQKKHARPISLRQRMRLFAKGKQKGSLGTDKRPGKAPFCGYRMQCLAGTKIFASNPFCIKGISG